MRTCLLVPSYLEGKDAQGNDRLKRTRDWIRFHAPFFGDLGLLAVRFLDDGSTYEKVEQAWDAADRHFKNISVSFSRSSHLGRGESLDYPYCWRNVWSANSIIQTGWYDRIIFMDTDAYILTPRMLKWFAETRTGWQTLFCERWQFPEAATWILGKDHFNDFCLYTRDGYQKYLGQQMETTLPFTRIVKDFNCDRWGEYLPPAPQTPEMDFYVQRPLTVDLKFNMGNL